MSVLVETVDWGRVRSLLGTSEFVPDVIDRLASAESDEAAMAAYWELDNRVVVGGELFEASELVVAPLLARLGGDVPAPACRAIVALMVQLVAGRTADSEIEAGNDDLADRVRQEMSLGLWIFYGLLDQGDEVVGIDALDVLEEIEPDRGRLQNVLSTLSTSGRGARVSVHARRLLDARSP